MHARQWCQKAFVRPTIDLGTAILKNVHRCTNVTHVDSPILHSFVAGVGSQVPVANCHKLQVIRWHTWVGRVVDNTVQLLA